MNRFFKLLIVGVIIEMVSLLGFIFASNESGGDFGKLLVVIISSILMFGLFWRAVAILSKLKVIILCASLSVAAVAVVQTFGYTLYPGLVKDIDFLSADYIELTLVGCSKIFVLFLVGIAILLCARKFFFWMRAKCGARVNTPSAGA